MDVYIQAGENAIKTDKKMLSKLLEEGKITQAVYDEVVLKDVTCGVGYNDLDELTRRVSNGTLKEAKNIVLPNESDKVYEGYTKNLAWIDSKTKQIELASMESKERDEIRQRVETRKSKSEDIEVPVMYKNRREVIEEKGKNITLSEIDKVKKIEDAVYRDEQKLLQDCQSFADIAYTYGIDEKNLELTMSKDGDWYMLSEERENEYYIADVAMVGGVNAQQNQKLSVDKKLATIEMTEKIYEKMLEMAEKEKTVRYEATRDTSYINTKKMKEKGLIEILTDEKDTFGNSNIQMNNVVIRPNKEKMQEELNKIRDLLNALRERELVKTVPKKKEESVAR